MYGHLQAGTPRQVHTYRRRHPTQALSLSCHWWAPGRLTVDGDLGMTHCDVSLPQSRAGKVQLRPPPQSTALEVGQSGRRRPQGGG